jgi:hypothetical protein
LNRCLSDLAGYIGAWRERAVLKAIVDLIEAYEQKCWPRQGPDVRGREGLNGDRWLHPFVGGVAKRLRDR